MYYFAYGSNMLTARLARRLPSVRCRGRAWLDGHRLEFNLRGSDGSGKCNVRHTGDVADRAHGVLFELDTAHLDRLHAIEGPAYAFVELAVASPAGAAPAGLYRGRPTWLDDRLVAFDWYLDFVLGGARAHGLPDDYIAWLARTPTRPDSNVQRARNNREILHEQPQNVLADVLPDGGVP